MWHNDHMNILFWGLTFGLIGKVLLAIGVLFAHGNLAHEHRVDRRVLRSFRIEFVVTVVGLSLILLGFSMEITFFHAADLLSCDGLECGSAFDQVLSN